MPTLAASLMIGHGVSSRSSHSAAAGRITSAAKSCSHFCSVIWSSLRSRVDEVWLLADAWLRVLCGICRAVTPWCQVGKPWSSLRTTVNIAAWTVSSCRRPAGRACSRRRTGSSSREGTARVHERHRRRGRHHQADPLPPLRRQERSVPRAARTATSRTCSSRLRAALLTRGGLGGADQGDHRRLPRLDRGAPAGLPLPGTSGRGRGAGRARRGRGLRPPVRRGARGRDRPGAGARRDACVRAAIWAHGIAGMVQAAGDWWLDQTDVPRPIVVDGLTSLLVTGFTDD